MLHLECIILVKLTVNYAHFRAILSETKADQTPGRLARARLVEIFIGVFLEMLTP